MKILYLHNSEYSSSMANLIQIKAMCKAMSDRKMDVTLSLQANGKKNLQVITEYPYNIDFRKRIINNKKIDKYINIQSVKKVINKINPDIIYLRSPLLLKQAENSKKPLIIELHNNKLHQGYAWLDKYWSRFLIRMSKSEQILKIVCISQALSDYWIKKGIPYEKVIIAHDAIDHQQFEKPLDRLEARRYLNLPMNNKIITYVGRLYKNRKIENILELVKTYSDALFLIIGGPDIQSQYYKEKADKLKLKNIIFKGQIPHENIYNYLYASDVLLGLWSSDVPTINYCSPLKLFEYMASGRIIVAHGFPTVKEVLTHKQNAILSEPDSLDDLIRKTGESLELSYPSSMADNARQLVMEYYTWENRTHKIFDSIIDKFN